MSAQPQCQAKYSARSRAASLVPVNSIQVQNAVATKKIRTHVPRKVSAISRCRTAKDRPANLSVPVLNALQIVKNASDEPVQAKLRRLFRQHDDIIRIELDA